MKQEIFDLNGIGMSDAIRAAFDLYERRGLRPGIVSAVHREQYRVYTAQGERRAEAIGSLLFHARSADELPAIGDWVAVQDAGPDEAAIHAVLPRRTVFSRRAAGTREERQIIAANVDLVFVVCGLDQDFNLRRIERYLVQVRESGAEAAIVLNKADVCADVPGKLQETQRIACGAPVIAISAQTAANVSDIRAIIPPCATVALTGSSGAGKSTLVNRLLGVERQRVQEVRESDSRGRHTTTHRELLPLPGGGVLIDSPGMRELQMWAGAATLDAAFEDVSELARRCRFGDCTHTVETGCAVRDAIDPDRLKSYRKLRAEAAWHDRQENVHEAQAVKQKWKGIHKAMRADKKRFPYT